MQFPGMKVLREIFVNIPQSIPHGDESLFQHCAVLNREILKNCWIASSCSLLRKV